MKTKKENTEENAVIGWVSEPAQPNLCEAAKFAA